MATHFAIVLGAWRLRVRIDLDEPRAAVLDSSTLADGRAAATTGTPQRARPAASTASPWN